MSEPRVLILRAPGTNCDLETAHAFRRAGGLPERWHIQRLLEQPRACDDFQILCLPGGFSYGDDIAAGRILGNQIRHHLRDTLWRFRDAGKLILGICNGFQILMKSGLLLADETDGVPPATLTNNDSGTFEARWVRLEVTSALCPLFAGLGEFDLPVAHAEGKFVPRRPQVLQELARAGQVVLRYRPREWEAAEPSATDQQTERVMYPDNPNGSHGDVAGVCDTTGRVCGLMPHPERFVEMFQHPRWTRRGNGGGAGAGEGLRVFQNAVALFR